MNSTEIWLLQPYHVFSLEIYLIWSDETSFWRSIKGLSSQVILIVEAGTLQGRFNCWVRPVLGILHGRLPFIGDHLLIHTGGHVGQVHLSNICHKICMIQDYDVISSRLLFQVVCLCWFNCYMAVIRIRCWATHVVIRQPEHVLLLHSTTLYIHIQMTSEADGKHASFGCWSRSVHTVTSCEMRRMMRAMERRHHISVCLPIICQTLYNQSKKFSVLFPYFGVPIFRKFSEFRNREARSEIQNVWSVSCTRRS